MFETFKRFLYRRQTPEIKTKVPAGYDSKVAADRITKLPGSPGHQIAASRTKIHK